MGHQVIKFIPNLPKTGIKFQKFWEVTEADIVISEIFILRICIYLILN